MKCMEDLLDLMTFEDECPECGEMSTHSDGHKMYKVRCYECNFSGTWGSLDEFVEWFEKQTARRARNEAKKSRGAKRLTHYEGG